MLRGIVFSLAAPRAMLPPVPIDTWSLTSLQQHLVKTGGRLVKHARYYWLLLAESRLDACFGPTRRLPQFHAGCGFHEVRPRRQRISSHALCGRYRMLPRFGGQLGNCRLTGHLPRARARPVAHAIPSEPSQADQHAYRLWGIYGHHRCAESCSPDVVCSRVPRRAGA